MSLVGNLEDLSLPDILQIVSLSKKSGILMLEREGQQGKILIRQGKVIQTVSPRPGRTLGEILVTRGLVRADDLQQALEAQRAGGNRELLGAFLVRRGLIDEASLEKVVQEQIEDAIVFFLSWREGTFNFELSDIQGRGEFSVDPHAFILERGIDTQWLVLEGTRLMDERSRARETRAAEPGPAPGGETSFADLDAEAAPVPGQRPLVLVDDDEVFRAQAAEALGRLGFRVVACPGVAAGLAALEREADGGAPVLVTDIVMPTSDNQGFLGGLELVERVRRSRPEVPVVAITAYPDENVKEKVLEQGGRFLLKPSGADAGRFFGEIAAALGGEASPVLAAAPGPSAAGPAVPEPAAPATPAAAPAPAGTPAPDLAAEALEAADAGPESREETAARLTPHEEALLRDMLEELKGPRATSEMGLLILRFAAELLNRAVLFVVKAGQAVGLGGFGVEVAGGAERRGGVRGIAIPLDAPSVLADVVRLRAPVLGALADTPWNRTLLDQLGGRTPVDAAALPLVSAGKVRVILYGDNLPEARSVGELAALGIFLAQAGLTLEKVLLEKKLKESGGPRPGGGQRVGGAVR